MDKFVFTKLFRPEALADMRNALLEHCGKDGARRITAEQFVAQYFDLSEIDLAAERERRGTTGKGITRSDEELLAYCTAPMAEAVQALVLRGALDDAENGIRFTQHYGARGGLGLVEDAKVAVSDLADKLKEVLEARIQPGVFLPTRIVAMACVDQTLAPVDLVNARDEAMAAIPELLKMEPFASKYGMAKGANGGIGLLESVKEVEAKAEAKKAAKAKNGKSSSKNGVTAPAGAVTGEAATA